MKLSNPFIKLPLAFDAERLAAEVRALPAQAWVTHPNAFAGNTACRLISVDGGENDEVSGRMAMTPHLKACPYIQQVLAQFGVVWGRSRLMRLAPGANVPEHADMNYHWFSRVRIHIPVLTRPGVRFWCEDEWVYMAPGEAWIFDNWRLHRVENDTSEERIHLVADTSGSAAFWNMAAAAAESAIPARLTGYVPGRDVSLALEQFNSFRVMPPAEVESLLGDLAADVQPIPGGAGSSQDVIVFQRLLKNFCSDWRQLWALYGDTDEGLPQFDYLAQAMKQVIRPLGEKLCMRSNALPAMRVLDARVGRYLISDDQPALHAQPPATPAASPSLPAIEPVFVIAAPRSGSTLLFETLACTPQWWTVGGEAHWLVEGFDQFAPGTDGVEDNRLDASHATPELAAEMASRLCQRLRGPQGEPLPQGLGVVRVLEKTPKNALRVSFFARLFPNAKFVFLWRDPRENISSIMEAWGSGGWVTYSNMPGWDGDWSLLLPPGWREMRGRSLAEVATFQWEVTNRIALNDLKQLPKERWMALSYGELTADPAAVVQRICKFAGVDFDAPLQRRVAQALPLSRHTLTRPQADKWRKYEVQILACENQFRETWKLMRELE